MTKLIDSPIENQIIRGLEPSSFEEIILPSNEKVLVPKCNLIFKKWEGAPIKNTYNNKAVIDFDGQPLFAELAILKILQKENWNGVWVDSYRNKYRTDLPEKNAVVELPAIQEELIQKIKSKTKKRGGCWDVFVWKGNKIKFVESKRTGKDALQYTQLLWLEKSLELGLTTNDFILAEWNLHVDNFIV